MSRPSDKTLSDEDRVLWNLVARSAKPLKGKRVVDIPETPPASMEEAMETVAPKPAASPAARPKQIVTHSLDKPTHEKLAKGRLPIEGRVDLHGMSQEQAYSLLLSFLHRAHAGGVRYVLVITGKGSSSGGEGVRPRRSGRSSAAMTMPRAITAAPARSMSGCAAILKKTRDAVRGEDTGAQARARHQPERHG
jgi:DNA-nicking Smr family endonuclease